MKIFRITLYSALIFVLFSCVKQETEDKTLTPLLEVEGKFLYVEDVQNIIPPNVSPADSLEIAERFERKWITDVLLYQNSKRNITDKDEIDRLIEEYRKSLIIHQYQQLLLASRLPESPSDEELKSFYEQYGDQLTLNENILKGLFLVVPTNAPQIANVRNWVKSGNTKALESIEKYSIRNAISYDYFGDRWIPFAEVLKKIPLQLEQPENFLATNRYYETSDSTKQYFLRIEAYKTIGQTEPFEMAKQKISDLIINKLKSKIISDFENELYNDAIKDGTVNYFNN